MSESYYMKGTGNWCKILGEPVDNYSKDGKEWTMDISPDKEGIDLLKRLKLDGRIKNKGDDRGDFFQFKQRAERRDGTPNKPIRVVDARNKPWPDSVKIGNGSLLEVKFNVKDWGTTTGVYPQAVRVLEHVSYEPVDFAPLPADSEYVAHAPDFEKDFGLVDDDLDDEIPE